MRYSRVIIIKKLEVPERGKRDRKDSVPVSRRKYILYKSVWWSPGSHEIKLCTTEEGIFNLILGREDQRKGSLRAWNC